MTTERTSGVIFDLDGTLYHLTKMRAQVTLRLLRSLAILRHFNASRNAVRREVFDDGAALATFFGEDLGRRAGVSPDRTLTWYRDEFLGAFADILDRHALPRRGLLPLLSRLRAAGIRLGVASDVGRVADKLRALGVPPEAFDDIVETEALGALKPSPRALLALAERWGLDPSRIVMVGDRADRDGAAADAAGMPVITVKNTPPLLGGRGRHTAATGVAWSAAATDLLRRTGLE